jgi:hypothetical protein
MWCWAAIVRLVQQLPAGHPNSVISKQLLQCQTAVRLRRHGKTRAL